MQVPSPYYRVASRALIFDDTARLLVLRDENNDYEIPGGGWEHDETFEDCIRREVMEELGVGVEAIGQICGAYNGVTPHGTHSVRLMVPVRISSYDFKLNEMVAVQFVTKSEFLGLDLHATANTGAQANADLIWQQVENYPQLL